MALALALGTIEAATADESSLGREASVRSVDGVNVRAAPAANAPVLTIAEGGDTLTLLDGPRDGWYKIRYDDVVGWASARYLGPVRNRGGVSTRGNRRGIVTETGARLPIPYLSQLDGSAYSGANCGPASIAMALAAFGKHVPITEIRRTANRMQGTTGWYESGTSLEVLAEIAVRNGLSVRGLFAGGGYDRWTFDEVREALRRGHAVIPQIHLATLPGQERSNRAIDHFIVIIGYDEGKFIYHDPAFEGSRGHSLLISEDLLQLAWKRSDYPFAAFSIGPGADMEALVDLPELVAAPPSALTAEDRADSILAALRELEAAQAAVRSLLEVESAVRPYQPPAIDVEPLIPIVVPDSAEPLAVEFESIVDGAAISREPAPRSPAVLLLCGAMLALIGAARGLPRPRLRAGAA